MKTLASMAAIWALAMPAFATNHVMNTVAEAQQSDQDLRDTTEKFVYRFSTYGHGAQDFQAQVTCEYANCLENWLLVSTSGDLKEIEDAAARLQGTIYSFVNHTNSETGQGDKIEPVSGDWSIVKVAGAFEAADIAAGELMYANACAQCHGRSGRGMASFPSIAGKEASYISKRLEQYRAGEAVGPNSALMMPVAAELSDEDIANLATFISRDFK